MSIFEEFRNRTQQFLSENKSFQDMAGDWWKEHGPMKPLHQMNECRMGYIVGEVKARSIKPMEKITVLDIGCGGGIACEALARLGCQVTGIDQCKELIQVAKNHAEENGMKINYKHSRIEDLSSEKFDLVLCLEVLEHVPNPGELVQQACNKTNLMCIFSTLNKTVSSFILSIAVAEYILRWIPRGTHDWNMYVRPSQLEQWLCQSGFSMSNIRGMTYNPLFQEWRTSNNVKVNYIATGVPAISEEFDTK